MSQLYLRKRTSILKGGIKLVINYHNYQLKCLVEHHAEAINRQHYTMPTRNCLSYSLEAWR